MRFPKIMPMPATTSATPRKTAERCNNSQDVDLILVVGAQNSSNSTVGWSSPSCLNRKAKLIDSANDIYPKWLEGGSRIGLTGRSRAPAVLGRQVANASPISVTDHAISTDPEGRAFQPFLRTAIDRAAAAPLTAGPRASRILPCFAGQELSRPHRRYSLVTA